MAVSSIEEFRTNLGNIVRPNKFIVTINPPSKLNGFNNYLDKLKFHVKDCKIPSRSVGEFAMNFHGQRLLLQGDNTAWEDLDIKILNEDTWKCRSLFEEWQNLIINTTSFKNKDLTMTNYRDLTSDAFVIVDQYNFKNQILASYKFFYAFPKNVTAIDLSVDTKDTAEEFNVTFGYSYWKKM